MTRAQETKKTIKVFLLIGNVCFPYFHPIAVVYYFFVSFVLLGGMSFIQLHYWKDYSPKCIFNSFSPVILLKMYIFICNHIKWCIEKQYIGSGRISTNWKLCKSSMFIKCWIRSLFLIVQSRSARSIWFKSGHMFTHKLCSALFLEAYQQYWV